MNEAFYSICDRMSESCPGLDPIWGFSMLCMLEGVDSVAANNLLYEEFGMSGEIIDELKTLDVNTLTPIECMSILSELSNKAKEF